MNARTFACIVCFTALACGAAFAQPPAVPAPAPPRGDRPAGRADMPLTGVQPTPTVQPPQTVQPAAPGQPAQVTLPPPRRTGQPVNIRVDVTITDQRGGTAALKKTVSVVTADRLVGFIRSTANYRDIGPVPLNVDTEPELLSDGSGKIRLGVNLQYTLPGGVTGASSESTNSGPLRSTEIRENLAVILESGKPIVVAQSADPVGDRQVVIELKATILR
jgi:hypothetical protein